MKKSESGVKTNNQNFNRHNLVDNQSNAKNTSGHKSTKVSRKCVLTSDNNSPHNEGLLTDINNKQLRLQSCSHLREDFCSPMVGEVEKLDKLDKKILTLISEQYHVNHISRTLNSPQSTIRYRLNRMEKKGLITKVPGAQGTKLHLLNSISSELLIHNEKEHFITPFTAHSMSFKFPILKGEQPKSSNMQKMNNWESCIFSYSTYKIRTTSQHIIIFINQDLGADNIDNLVLKYSQLAQAYANKFAKKHNITLGTISLYRKGHYTIKDSALGQIIAERGEFRTQSGLMIDSSRSNGDVEMEETSARSFEYTLNKLPIVAAGLQGEMRDVTLKIEKLSSNIADIQALLQIDRENSQMLSHMKKEVETLSIQANELESQVVPEEKLNPDKTADRVYA